MSVWPSRKYREFVEKNASAADAPLLLNPASEAIDPDWPNIQVTFFPMNSWMEWFDIVLDESSFKLFLHQYRRDVRHYKEDLQKQFAPIKRYGTGRALLCEIRRRKDKGVVKFRPNWDWSDIVNAETIADKERDATAKGQPISTRPHASLGTGNGTNSTIQYTPEMWGEKGASRIHAPSFEPDEVIYHEMVHASRQLLGVQEATKVKKGYGDVEEYLATVLTNVYLSDKGQTKFAANHGTGTLKDPEHFLDNAQHVDMSPRTLLRSFRGAQPEFYGDLAKFGPPVPKFNPVWQFDQEIRAGVNKN